MKIPFNKPCLAGREIEYIAEAVKSGKISGNGTFTRKCHEFFEKRYGIGKALLTTSCTDALEMSAILAGIEEGDEVIVPSYTFVSTANAFLLRGARIVFADSEEKTPNIDATRIEALVTEKTRAIVPVHYSGVACDMDPIMAIAEKHGLLVIEDNAMGVESSYRGRPLGTIGHLAAFSFHETKNIISGEGGLLAVNDDRFAGRAEIIWEKGTNRAEFARGEVNKYGWVDIGSSFLPSDIVAAFLYAQLEELESIQAKRIKVWNMYSDGLHPLEEAGKLRLPHIPEYAANNAHLFYVLMPGRAERDSLLEFLRGKGILAVFHYLPLHESDYFRKKHDGRRLPRCVQYSDTIVRLPLYPDMTVEETGYVIGAVRKYFGG
jgi:dTDP-4-amino-4,6-dideoxygalactose transaminase